jgi:ribosomal protein L11 methyltransferase
LADGRVWPALVVRAAVTDPVSDERVAALVDGFAPIAIEELTPLPLPPGGLWDPTFPPPPDPPPAPLHWRVFFDTAADRDRAATTLQMEHPTLELTPEDVADEDWAARSQRSLTAVTAGLFVVAPPWDIPEVSDRQTLLVIEPSRGFGTGHHQSTRLCLRALSDVDLHGTRVLDLGTGSGVLALAASLRGAAHVLALDVDDDAIESARESHRLNPAASGIEWLVADFRQAGQAQIDRAWQVVLANLTGGMLRSSAERLRELVSPGGLLIVSGFDEQERPDVQAALQLEEREALIEDSWVGLVLRQLASEARS